MAWYSHRGASRNKNQELRDFNTVQSQEYAAIASAKRCRCFCVTLCGT